MIFRQIETAAGHVTICFTGKDRDLAADTFTQIYRNIRQKLDNRCAIVWAEQVHGNTVLSCDGTDEPISCAGEGDAIITRADNTAPLVRTADCIPILFYAEDSRLVGAVHAGWRGLHKQVLSRALTTALAGGVDKNSLRFVVGPFIREHSYEVGGEVAAQFAGGFSSLKPNGKFLLNLRAILLSEMAAVGIAERQITWFDTDTLTSQEWFSARRGDTGRNMALIFYSS